MLGEKGAIGVGRTTRPRHDASNDPKPAITIARGRERTRRENSRTLRTAPPQIADINPRLPAVTTTLALAAGNTPAPSPRSVTFQAPSLTNERVAQLRVADAERNGASGPLAVSLIVEPRCRAGVLPAAASDSARG